ncbi:MAG TPA: hypothetical protein ENF55_01110 [Thermoprotei archaeon]|nr:hypothetical protein [Thermoprotei archaeon]
MSTGGKEKLLAQMAIDFFSPVYQNIDYFEACVDCESSGLFQVKCKCAVYDKYGNRVGETSRTFSELSDAGLDTYNGKRSLWLWRPLLDQSLDGWIRIASHEACHFTVLDKIFEGDVDRHKAAYEALSASLIFTGGTHPEEKLCMDIESEFLECVREQLGEEYEEMKRDWSRLSYWEWWRKHYGDLKKAVQACRPLITEKDLSSLKETYGKLLRKHP